MSPRFLVSIIGLLLPLIAHGQTISVDGMREDLRALVDSWSQTDRSLTPERRLQFNTAVADISRRAVKLSPIEFALEVSGAVAIARNGHSQALIEDRLHGLPVGFAWFADGLFVVRADTDHSNLLGARVEKFGSLRVDEASTRAGRLISGNDAWVRHQSGVWLSSLEVLHHIGATARADSSSLLLKLADGRRRRVSLETAAAPDPSPAPAWMGLVPAPAGMPGRWTHVLDRLATRPVAYGEVSNLTREWWQDNRVFYLRSNYIYGTATNRYELFDKLIGVLQVEVAERHPRVAIIDLRLNHGGDFFNTVSFTHALPKLIPPDGKIFVLVGPDTFSAAIATAAMLKSAGGERVLFVGDELGDNAAFWSEGPAVTLPNSHIVITSGTRLHNWSSACAGSDDCYWGNIAFGPDHISLEPDISVVPTFAEYEAGRDPVLQAALEAAGIAVKP